MSDDMPPGKSQDQALLLPPVLAIGFSGGRESGDNEAARRWIRSFLEDQRKNTSGIVYGVCALSAGSSLLFAESCLELKIPLRILIASQEEELRTSFDDNHWPPAQKILREATSVDVISAGRSGEERDYQCAIEVVQQSRVTIAFGNGTPSPGLTGIDETVAFASALGRAVFCFDSIHGTLKTINENALSEVWRDSELDFLNKLPDMAGEARPESPRELANAWFRKIDDSASRFAPQVRRLASIPIVYTAVAALFSGFGIRGPSSGIWLTASALMGLAAAWIPGALKLSHRQALWARTRTAAEVCRSVLALWDAPWGAEAVSPETVPELSGMLSSLNLLKMMDRSRAGISPQDFKERYLRERLLGQIGYFQKHAGTASKNAKQYRVVSRACTTSAIALTAALAISGIWSEGAPALPHARWLRFAATALFQIATVSGAWLIVNDSRRRSARYQQMHEWLKEWKIWLDSVHTWPAVLQVVDRIEKVLQVELIEWKALMQNVKMPRK